MSCKLVPAAGSPPPSPAIPSGPNVFTAPKDKPITVFADSDSSTVHLTAAHLNGTNVAVDANSKATFTVGAGANILSMAFTGSDPEEVFRIMEDCGEGNSQTLRTWRLKLVVPGGPSTQITINAV